MRESEGDFYVIILGENVLDHTQFHYAFILPARMKNLLQGLQYLLFFHTILYFRPHIEVRGV